MTGSRLLIGVASVLAGTTVLLSVFGLVYNPILLVAAVPFAVATYFLWSHGTGRLDARMRERSRSRRADAGFGPFGGDGDGDRFQRDPGAGATSWKQGRSTRGRGQRTWQQGRGATSSRRPPRTPRPGGDSALSSSAAARVLGVDRDADEASIRRAFREKAKEFHPDAPDGDEAAFRRARAAYERLTDDT